MSEFEKAAEEFAIEQSELRDKNGPTGNYDNRTWPNEQLDQFMMRHGFIAGARWQEEKAKGLVEALEEELSEPYSYVTTRKRRIKQALKAYGNEKGEQPSEGSE